MVKKVLALTLALAFLGLNLMATDAQAKRRCQAGYEDVNNVCVPK